MRSFNALVTACIIVGTAGRNSRRDTARSQLSVSVNALGGVQACVQPSMRPTVRTFVSPAIDNLIVSLVPKFKNASLATIFSNALPNSLDTTVYQHIASTSGQEPDTFIVTGDILAMWLRDSTNQVLPYIPYAATDPALQSLIVGLIGRQARSVLIDPYANAYQVDSLHGQGPHSSDNTYTTMFAGTVVSAMTPSIFERKWEVDSLANVLRLSATYYTATQDTTPFNATWVAAVTTILDTFLDQQQDTAMENANGGPTYVFQRTTTEPSDSLEQGRGYPVKYTGMIKGGFRGSDDACVYSYSIPENAFTSVALRDISTVLTAVGQTGLASRALNMAAEIETGLQTYGTMEHPTAGKVWAYEVDGFGNAIFMDDANIPSLIGMPYYNFTSANDPLYLNTRRAALSAANPWFLNGTAGSGIGGPHNGWPYIWPMSILMQGWTAQSDAEIMQVLNTLIDASACTGLVHESFNANDVTDFTRPWFAWVNSLFGAFILKLAAEKPYLIFN